MEINVKSKEEMLLIHEIAKRACRSLKNRLLIDIDMNITATHLNGNPLKLKELLDTDDYNFLHDIIGIENHIDRETGKLQNCFLPRYSA